ncbi:MAG TPA: hypothetical protein VFQ61_25570 [Polyangiaceae bacterium]|nr:hypothetical protein [Polyangiaceae bacterium]
MLLTVACGGSSDNELNAMGGSTSGTSGGTANATGGVTNSNGGTTSVSGGSQSGGASATSGGASSTSGGASSTSGGATTKDPFSTPVTCTSNVKWTRGENDRMRPGEACIACHAQTGDAPKFTIAGTVYPTGHEPNDCNGVTAATATTIVITDANQVEHKISANSAGNFMLSTSVATPYTAKVVTSVGERKMFSPQTSGDCNSCHTQDGSNGAPGRVLIP